jgi:hypothetical protein
MVREKRKEYQNGVSSAQPLGFVRYLDRYIVGVLTCLLFISTTAVRSDDIPTWKKPLPGTAAILGDDGGGESEATLCDTASHVCCRPMPEIAPLSH